MAVTFTPPGEEPLDLRAGGPVAPWLRYGAIAALLFSIFTVSHALANSRSESYKVSARLDFQPYDARLWAAAHAGSRDAAAAIDPTIPDPTALNLFDAGTGQVLTPLQIREQAFIGPAANRYVFHGATALDSSRALQCLTTAIYYEAASESDDGMRGVAQVVLNRVRHPSFPNSVCGVVYQGSDRTTGCQFSFACDGAMARQPSAGPWARARRIAAEALSGKVFSGVGLATHYHTQAIWPYWGKTLVMTNVIGAHIFHRWRGRWGEIPAFRQPYSGHEPFPGPYRPVSEQIAGKLAPASAITATGAASALDPAIAKAIADAKASEATATSTAATSPAATATYTSTARVAGPELSSAPATAATALKRDYIDPSLNKSGEVQDAFKESGAWIGK